MRIIFIYPSMGNRESYRVKMRGGKIKSWSPEPLTIATLNGLTPAHYERIFFDDRLEPIDYDINADLVAITAETFTVKRAYQIASEFRKRGKQVIMGGFHASILPEEAIDYCDSILIGEAEGIWDKILADAEQGKLAKIYRSTQSDLSTVRVDRSIYGNKKYFPVTMVESGRGCKFHCDFCSVTLFFQGRHRRRPIAQVIEEIKKANNKLVLFVDDNICADFSSAKELFRALIPLKIKWMSSASVDIVHDGGLLDLIKKSGCQALLVGFESINSDNLSAMHKNQNLVPGIVDRLIKELYKRKIKIYATFVMGYDYEDNQSAQATFDYAMKNKFLLSNFYQLTPLPGTNLYKKLEKENRLIYKKWWLDDAYSYGEVVFQPKNMKRFELSAVCQKMRLNFYSFKNIMKRSLNFGFRNYFFYLVFNLLTRKEIIHKQGRILGRNKS